MYRPLPDELTIKNSPIEGLGLFATSNIKANSFIGITHIRDEQFENKYMLHVPNYMFLEEACWLPLKCIFSNILLLENLLRSSALLPKE